jgi:hypothetical protein
MVGLGGAAAGLGWGTGWRPDVGAWPQKFIGGLADENIGVIVLGLGLLVALLAFLWLVVEAFRTDWRWGLPTLIPPLGLVFAARHPRRGGAPLGLLCVGLLVAAAPVVLPRYFLKIDLGPRDTMVGDERHVTLTGWDRRALDYPAALRAAPDVVVLQMANPDVTDQALDSLVGLTRLKELDLSRTAITDRSLEPIGKIPALEILRLAGTAITDEGFRNHLAKLPNLRLLDLRDTAVSPETIRAWRDEKPGRKALVSPGAPSPTIAPK